MSFTVLTEQEGCKWRRSGHSEIDLAHTAHFAIEVLNDEVRMLIENYGGLGELISWQGVKSLFVASANFQFPDKSRSYGWIGYKTEAIWSEGELAFQIVFKSTRWMDYKLGRWSEKDGR